MKRRSFFWLALMALVFSLAGPISQIRATEVSYKITNQDVTAEITAEGNVKFTQKWVFDASFMNGALLKVDTGGFELGAYKVGVENGDKLEEFTEDKLDSKRPKTFHIQSNRDVKTFKAYYPVSNKKVTFVAEYTLNHIVTNYADTAEFNRKLIGEGVDFKTDVTAKVILPPGQITDKDSFKAWAHGGTGSGTVELGQENGRSVVILKSNGTPANRFVEVHTIFPTSLTPHNTNVVNQNMKEEIESKEAAQAEADRKAYESQKYATSAVQWGAMILMSLLPFHLWRKYFKLRRQLNPNPVQLPIHNYNLPSHTAPAVVTSAVFRSSGEPNPDDFSATVADLARKGYLELEEERRENRGIFSNSSMTARVTKLTDEVADYPLQGHERAVLTFLFPDDETSVTLEDLEKRMKKNRHFAKKRLAAYENFQSRASIAGSQLVESARDKNNSLRFQAIGAIILNVILGGVALFAGFMATNHPFLEQVGWIALGLALFEIFLNVVFIITVSVRPLRTAEEDQLYQEWHGFAKMLEDVGQMNMRDIASLALWEEYLVYAIAFGIADKVLDALKVQFTQAELVEGMTYYPMYYNTGLYSHVLSQSISSNVSSASTYSQDHSYSGSNSGGFGGGFSGGSSGGSGGGGGASGF